MKGLLVFATGKKKAGGTGFLNLIESTKTGVLQGEIVGVVSNIPDGAVRRIAQENNIPFEFLESFDEVDYKAVAARYKPCLYVLSGWMRKVKGLDPTRTINIHPGKIPEFGGEGLFGNRVHEAVLQAFKRGEITSTAVCMHFVTEEFDQGPVFFEYPVLIRADDTVETLSQRVKAVEHAWQPYITNLVLQGRIAIVNGKIYTTANYDFLPKQEAKN